MGKYQQSAAGSIKTEKTPQFRWSRAGTAFLRDYFRYTNNAPKKKERQEILARVKELGDTEATDTRVNNWFIYVRQKEKTRPSFPPPTSASEPNESKWVDARHKTLWPTVAKESFRNLEELHNQHVALEGLQAEPPYDLWAEGLSAKPEHVRLWCKFKVRQYTRQPQSDAVPMTGTSSRTTEEHSQLPTPGNSTSPEPAAFTAWPPPSPDLVKDEPPVSPVVERTQFPPPPEGPKVKSSLGLHAAIESAFSAPPHLPTPSIQPPELPSPSAGVDQQRKPSSRNPSRPLAVLQHTAPSISVGNITALTSATLPPASIASPPSKPESSTPPPHREPSIPPSPEESIPEPPAQPDRDIARERASLVTGVAKKLDELNVMFSSTHGLSQLAGSIQGISRRNQQFLDDVAGGRFEKFHLTSAHLPQEAGPMPEFNPLRVLVGWQGGKEEGEEREEDEMKVD